MSLTGLLLRSFGSSGTALDTPTLAIEDNGDGTVTATITGSSAGSTNTLYYQAAGDAIVGSSWTAAGTSVGDGTITATLPQGYYWWYVGSAIAPDTVVSNLVYQNATAGLTAVHWACLEHAQARIQALNLAGIDNRTSVVIKKLAPQRILGSLATLGIPLPCVLLLPVTETQNPTQGTDEQDDVDYGIYCLTVAVDNQEPTLAAGISGYLLWRQQINRAFRNQGRRTIGDLPGTINLCTVEPQVIYDNEAWGAQYDVSLLVIRYLSREKRGLNA